MARAAFAGLGAAGLLTAAAPAWAQSTAPAAPAATATVVYGLIDAAVRRAGNARADGSHASALTDGVYGGSRFGLRRTQDLGEGLSAGFILEAGYDPSTGVSQQASSKADNGNTQASNGRLFGREASLSLGSAQLGTLSLGRQYTVAHVLSGRFQAQSNPNLDALSVFSGHHVARQDNLLRYGHTLGPVELMLAHSFNENAGKGGGLGLAYKGSGWEAMAYRQHITSADLATTRQITGVGGHATLGPVKLYLGWMKRHDEAATARDNTVRSLGLNWSMRPSTTLTASVLRDRQTGAKDGTRAVSTVGLIQQLHRSTDLYLVLDRNTLSGTYPQPDFMGTREAATGSSLGVRHRF
jgi:predicted porin